MTSLGSQNDSLRRNSAVRRYTLLQIPELALLAILLYWFGDKLGLDIYIRVLLLILWIIKDILLFFWVWPAYTQRKHTVQEALIGKEGESVEVMKPRGYISVAGELWEAELVPPHTNLKKGHAVRVVAEAGMLLQVEPLAGKE